MAGDKGYRAEWVDQLILSLGILPVIPSKENEDRDQRGVGIRFSKLSNQKYR